MNTTISDFYKFVENSDRIDFNIKENVLDFLNDYDKKHKDFDFDAEKLENRYNSYIGRRFRHRSYPFTDSEYYTFFNLFRYQYSFINLVRAFTNATDHNPTESLLIYAINKHADEYKKIIIDDHTEGGYGYSDEGYCSENRDAVKKYFSGDNAVDFRISDYIRPILNKVEAEIEDMIDSGLIKTKRDLWTNWLRLIEIDLIPQIKNPVDLCGFWSYVANNIYYEF